MRLSFYCTDGKGGFMARSRKAPLSNQDKALISELLGDTDAGEYGVDILNGVDPQFVGETIRSIMQQANRGGESGDLPWPTMRGLSFVTPPYCASGMGTDRRWRCVDAGDR